MLKPGMILCDRYEILEVVGAGGMSIVYKARCHRLNRNVAIKVLKPEFSNDKNFVTKFKIEAQASAGLTHPNIVNVYDVYDDEGIYFIVMELVDGITLKEYIQENGRLPMDKALDFSIQIASGIEAAHENHIIHRDIKPQNIIVSRNGNIKVTDFGIAKAASSNTLTSGAMGSVHYISPEQARGGYSDERSDIYSLGITMYEMVTGRVPFEGDNNVSVALMHIQSEMISPRQYYPDIYTSFEKIILKATQKKPERRYLTASALIADLKRVQNNPNIDIVVAPTAITNSPTQEWTKEDMQAIREGSALNAFSDNQPVQNEMSELRPIGGLSTIPVNKKINELLDEDPWDDYEQEEEIQETHRRTNGIKKVQDEELDDDFVDDADDDEIDPGLKRAVAIAGVATAVIIVIIIAVVVSNFMGGLKFGKNNGSSNDSTSGITTENAGGTDLSVTEDNTTEGLKYAMIDVKGYSKDAAVKMLKDIGFTNVNVEEETNSEVQEGYVFEQNYNKNDMLDADAEIIIKVSTGAELLSVPSVVGYTDSQAVTILQEAGFAVSHAYEYSDDVEKDKVVVQDPVAETQAEKGSTVIITISNGPETKTVIVPNLYGLTEAQAVDSLSNYKLVAGSVTHGYSDSVGEGYVMSQGTANGTTVNEGTVIDFVISDGPEPKPETYTASVTGVVAYNGTDLDGQAVTVQLMFGSEVVDQKDMQELVEGSSITLAGTKTGLENQSGEASIVVIDASGNNVTNYFSPSVNISYLTE